LERTEALFAVLWMAVVFANGSVLVWSVSESVHQLFHQKRNPWLHWGAVLSLLCICTQLKNLFYLLELARMMAYISIGLVPALLLLVLVGTLLRGRKEDAHESADMV
jgi:hypothetical protein